MGLETSVHKHACVGVWSGCEKFSQILAEWGATDDADCTQLHGACEGHVDEELWVVVVAGQCRGAEIETVLPGPEHSACAACCRLVQGIHLQLMMSFALPLQLTNDPS